MRSHGLTKTCACCAHLRPGLTEQSQQPSGVSTKKGFFQLPSVSRRDVFWDVAVIKPLLAMISGEYFLLIFQLKVSFCDPFPSSAGSMDLRIVLRPTAGALACVSLLAIVTNAQHRGIKTIAPPSSLPARILNQEGEGGASLNTCNHPLINPLFSVP